MSVSYIRPINCSGAQLASAAEGRWELKMLAILFLLCVLAACQGGDEDSEQASWPLFEFWNPLTWITPRFSTETVFQILSSEKNSNRKLHQQLKKALLPANLFFGNIRAQRAAWDGEKTKKSGRRRPRGKSSGRKSNKQ